MIRKARISDAETIYGLISRWSKQSKVLPRPLNYIYENLRDFWVYEQKKKVVGACALHVVGWQGLAEVKSLVVAKRLQGRKIGTEMVQSCLKEAEDLGIETVFALTFVPGFFRTLGFRRIDKGKLPHKIWSDCVNCVFFPHKCKEEAVALKIK